MVEKHSLKLEIEKIDDDAGLTLDVTEPFSFFFDGVDGVEAVSDVAINISITKSGDEVFAAGNARGTVKLQCSRCLEEFESELSADIEAPYFKKSEEKIPDEDEGDVNYHDGKTLDLFEVLHDQLFLAIPLKPLCREDCKGLCPNCGADLNRGPCGCSGKKPDPRLDGLKKLKL